MPLCYLWTGGGFALCPMGWEQGKEMIRHARPPILPAVVNIGEGGQQGVNINDRVRSNLCPGPQALLGKPILLQSLLQWPEDFFTGKMLLPFRSKVEAMGAWIRYNAVWVLVEERSLHRNGGGNNKYLAMKGDTSGTGWQKP